MSANNSGTDNSGQEKQSQSEASVPQNLQTIPQNLTTIQNIQTVQNIQNIQNVQSVQSVQSAVASNVQNIQTAQAVTGQTATLVGKSISLDLNSKLLLKPAISSNIVTSESNKIVSTAFCPGSAVKIIAPNILNTIERQIQSQVQQGSQQTIVTNLPSTYHVPRGPAAVANISNPRSTVATPLVRTIAGQQIPISRPGNSPMSGKPRAPVGVANNPTSRASDASTHSSAAEFTKTVTIYKSRVSQEHGTADVARTLSNEHSKIPLKKRALILCVNPSTTVTTQWQPKSPSVVYTQTTRQATVVSRPIGRPTTATVFTNQPQQPQSQPQPQQTQQQQQQTQSQQPQLQTILPQPQQQAQPRLVSPNVSLVRPLQANVVASTSARLIAPMLQTQNTNITRIPVTTRPPTPQVVVSAHVTQTSARPISQIQPNQTSRTLTTTPLNRVTVTNPVIGAPNRVAVVTSVQASIGRQLTINTVAGAPPGTVSRIVIPQQALTSSKIQIQQPQPQQQQQSQGGGTRVVQTVTPLGNFSSVGRVITTPSTNSAVAANVTRIAQTGPTSVTRITGMSLHPLPAALAPGRNVPPLKVTQTPSIQTVQLKQGPPTIQSQTPQPQQQPPQSQQSQQSPAQQQVTFQRAIGTGISTTNPVSSTTVVTSQPQPGQGQYLHASSHSATYISIDASGNYYRSGTVQPMRVLMEQGFDEPLSKPNASPRPSILRKRDVDSSPAKSVAKNLVPVLAALPASSSASSPPGSPKCDRDGGNRSSGSTTVSATSSPGLDEEPEQLRIPMNIEMSPRKKPRKQQLTGVELIEPRCTDEDMQFITEEKIKKDNKDDARDKYNDRKSNQNQQENKSQQEPPVKSKPSLSMIGNSWKNNYYGRANHYKRPSDVNPREDKKPTVAEIAQQKQIVQKLDGWKLYHLRTQWEDLSDTEKSAHKIVKATMVEMELLRGKNEKDDSILDKINELCKGNMQRHNLVSEGLHESKEQLFLTMAKHKPHVKSLLQNNSNKRVQKKRDK